MNKGGTKMMREIGRKKSVFSRSHLIGYMIEQIWTQSSRSVFLLS